MKKSLIEHTQKFWTIATKTEKKTMFYDITMTVIKSHFLGLMYGPFQYLGQKKEAICFFIDLNT